jgi:hypothetical protein
VADVATASFGSVATSQPCHYRAIRSGPDRAPADNYGQRQVRVQFLESRQLLRASTPQLAYSLSQAEAVGASQEDSPPGLFRLFILASDLQADNLAD